MLADGNERILVIAPHADDEVLGCGGLIKRARNYENDVKVIIGSVGDISIQHKNDGIIESQTRKEELREALAHLGCEDYRILFENKESAMDTIPMNQIVTKLDQVLQGFDPTMSCP